ncbi:MAG TPA: hypothetical protein VD886_01785, partial [Herpetosiphonaceae bacterium]|nr:hypothetical protein [Herpetosiphonaceae bacterium]
MSKSDPSVNPNARQEREQPAGGQADQANRHRSAESLIEGGQNQYEGEPHEGYGSDQAQSQSGKG